MGEAGIWCFIVCFGSAPVKATAETGSFCQLYQQQVLSKAEVSAIMKLPKNLRDRLQGNELHYLCLCKNAKLKECENG